MGKVIRPRPEQWDNGMLGWAASRWANRRAWEPAWAGWPHKELFERCLQEMKEGQRRRREEEARQNGTYHADPAPVLQIEAYAARRAQLKAARRRRKKASKHLNNPDPAPPAA